MKSSGLKDETEEEREYRFTDRDFRILAGLVRDRTGIALSDEKKNLIYGRLSRRLRHLQLESFKEYCKLLEDGEDAEFQNFVNAVTTNHTKFFREAHHFVHMKNEFIPQMEAEASRPGKSRFRIWSAACSSGEEPYSIALTLMAYMKSLRNCDIRILATDLDSNVLQKAMAGEYAGSQYSDLPPGLIDRLPRKTVLQSGDRMKMTDAVCDLVTFRQLNLLSAWPLNGKFDAIVCRNVMIYFDDETKQSLVRRFDGQLKVGGFLYTGHAESLLGMLDNYKMVGRTVYEKME